MELGAGKGMRPLTFVDRMTAAILHPLQFVLALVEFVVADRGNLEPHHRQRFDRRFIVEHRGQKRARANQVSGRDEDGVLVALAELPDQRRHGFGTAGRHHDLPGLVGGVGDPDPAGGGAKVTVEIVDREDPDIDRHSLCYGAFGRTSCDRNERHRGENLKTKDQAKRMSHDFKL